MTATQKNLSPLTNNTKENNNKQRRRKILIVRKYFQSLEIRIICCRIVPVSKFEPCNRIVVSLLIFLVLRSPEVTAHGGLGL